MAMAKQWSFIFIAGNLARIPSSFAKSFRPFAHPPTEMAETEYGQHLRAAFVCTSCPLIRKPGHGEAIQSQGSPFSAYSYTVRKGHG